MMCEEPENNEILNDQSTIPIRSNSDECQVPTQNKLNTRNGENDIFFIQGGDKVQVIRDFEVFDRWGSLMFRNSEFLPNDSAEGWDGIFKGEEASLGVYVYKFEVEFIWADFVQELWISIQCRPGKRIKKREKRTRERENNKTT